MRKILSRGAVIGVVAASAAVLLPQAASAAAFSSTCQATVCDLYVSGYQGGGLSIDADVHGSGTGRWELWSLDENWYHVQDFDAAAGPGSWLRSWSPKGRYHARVTGPSGPTSIGLRWLDNPTGS
ncbi:hypothetical protein [Amycolatopsis magusensis]|uniref:hypothetical protein n=1 Tax=Amycolatopsis magusensis TaxID=882444 RepID=UPI0024A85ECC|nr:hypothetical protein [Amycolatopsis magusensis]MDI5980691.1 hypothetical protein [Amycolatopsis magusensis]